MEPYIKYVMYWGFYRRGRHSARAECVLSTYRRGKQNYTVKILSTRKAPKKSFPILMAKANFSQIQRPIDYLNCQFIYIWKTVMLKASLFSTQCSLKNAALHWLESMYFVRQKVFIGRCDDIGLSRSQMWTTGETVYVSFVNTVQVRVF